MIKNYFKTAIRSLRKQGIFAVTNVIGLATGIACFILISLFVRDELTYDKFHKNADRIYRGISEYKQGFVTGFPDYMVELMKEQMPEVESATRIDFGARAIMKYQDKLIFENEYYHVDPEIFDIFDFSLLYGDEKEALVGERSIVISQYIMNKYFDGENPVGEFLEMNNETEPYLITGVLNEIPANSRFQFNFLAPAAKPSFETERAKWQPSGLLYVLLKPGTQQDDFESAIAKMAEINGYPSLKHVDFLIEGYGDLYLESQYSFTAQGVSGDKQFIWIFGAIGLVLLLIACINYINSSTARALNRNKEIGVRRTIGASGKQIRYQFLAETLFTTILAVLLSAGLVELLLPVLNGLAEKQLSMDYFTDPYTLPFLLLMVPLVTMLAGVYPAFFSSRIRALDLFSKNGKVGKGQLRNYLVVFQFVITLTLIFATQIIVKQVDKLQSAEIGLNSSNVVSPSLPWQSDFDLFKNTLEKVAGVEAVTSTPFPNPHGSQLKIKFEHEGKPDSLNIYYYRVTANTPEVFDMTMVQGVSFDQSAESLYEKQVLISQTVASRLPYENPIGRELTIKNDDYAPEKRTIVGVYQNLNFNAKGSDLPSIMITTKKRYNMNLKLTAENQENIMLNLTNAWAEVAPDQPFEYRFLDDRIASYYEKERKFGQIFKYFAGIAILIAALGLLGLSAFTVIQKYKEIGIRKVLGATVSGITLGLMRKYVSLILIATVLATPLAYFLMNNWLDDFATRISMSAGIFLLGFIMAVGVLVLTVGYQTIRAALLNPVVVLKDE
ncbi:MAG: FtsX-like permease family protein [Roseivirga sp.]|nr:FtsX-like permease family protein [Roseivirga sp.]